MSCLKSSDNEERCTSEVEVEFRADGSAMLIENNTGINWFQGIVCVICDLLLSIGNYNQEHLPEDQPIITTEFAGSQITITISD